MFINYEIDSLFKGLLYVVTILVIALLLFLKKKNLKFSYRVLIGLTLGVVVGLLFGNYTTSFYYYEGASTIPSVREASIIEVIRPIGQLYLKLIQLIVIPLVLTSIIKSFTSISDITKLKKIGFKTLFWLLFTTALGTIIGFIFASIFDLGTGYAVEGSYTPKAIKFIENVILDFFPNNIFGALTGSVVIPVVVFGIFVSIAVIKELKKHPERMKPFLEFNEAFNHIMIQITKMIMQLTPYAVFSFIAYAVARNSINGIGQLGIYILVIYLAMFVHFVVVQMGLIRLFGLNPFKFIKNYFEAMTVAFTTQSSYGTLPVTSRVLKERLGVSDGIVDFVAPIGANVGMNACGGIFPAIVAVITANAFGIELSIIQMILLVITTTIASIGIAGVPGIATIAATVTLSAMGLPIEGIALIIAVDPLVDMGRTMINVVGTGVASVLVAKSENEINMEVFNQKNEKFISE